MFRTRSIMLSLAVCGVVALAKSGCRTLLVDLDPQCNATTAMAERPTGKHPLSRGAPIRHGIVTIDAPSLELLPGSSSFRDVETLTRAGRQEADRLRRDLVHGFSGYDFVLVDCPPSVGQLTRVALSASTEVFIPIRSFILQLQGTGTLSGTL